VTLFSLVTANAQQSQPQGGTQSATQDNDTTRGELASFDRFMDGHPEIAEQLRRDPSLVRNEDFVRDHRDLQEYLQQHPEVREEIRENPDRFMRQEQRFDRREDRRDLDRPEGRRDNDRRDNDTTREELASFDRFMDGHPEIAEQLRRDPSLVKNEDFVRNHRDLQQYLQQHPGVREEISENPDRFMRQEQRFDRAEDRHDFDRPEDRRDNDRRDQDRVDNDRRDNDRRDNDTTREQLASFDRFLDSHPEIAEQLRRDPSLAKNQDFVRNHPALQEYLQQHPGTREEISENPDRFMRQEQRFNRIEDNRNRDMSDGDRAGFGEFLGSHSSPTAPATPQVAVPTAPKSPSGIEPAPKQ
jgi:phosphoserine phosphatase